jgi:hypothetical protein
LAPPLRVVVAVAAVRPVPLPQEPEVAAVLLVLLEVVVDLAHPAHKLLQVAAVLLVPLPQEPEVAAALLLVQGLVASESLRSR